MKEIISEVYNIDCIEYMKQFPDKHFELAIVDPPYGIGEGSDKIKSRHHSQNKYKTFDWDKTPPSDEYFNQLIRVSKNQIIWGANHFISQIPFNSSCWVIWDKDTGTCDFADAELAYTSFKTAVRIFKFTWNGFRQGYDYASKEQRIHPTQKPVALYKWLLQNYAKDGDKILDTHLGSGSSRIAAYDMGFDFYATELDKDYFEASIKRFEQYKAQLKLF
jgi:site-specific DNA-methyltransferase (adenine-specific)